MRTTKCFLAIALLAAMTSLPASATPVDSGPGISDHAIAPAMLALASPTVQFAAPMPTAFETHTNSFQDFAGAFALKPIEAAGASAPWPCTAWLNSPSLISANVATPTSPASPEVDAGVRLSG